MRLPTLAIGLAALALTSACQGLSAGAGHDSTPAKSSTNANRPTPSPTPSTRAQVAAAIRTALMRQGSGTVKISDHEAAETSYSKFQIDCGATDPRAAFNTVIPGRDDEPARVKMRMITSGQDLYTHLVESIGGKRARLTVWMGNNFLPTKYQISVGDHDVEAARWVVSFGKWHMAPIKLPPKSEIR